VTGQDIPDEKQAHEPTLASLIGAVVAYAGARLVLVALVALAIYGVGSLVHVTIPPIVAAAFAVVIALPLGMLLFKSLRKRVNAQITGYDEVRARRREELHGRLRGTGR